MSAMATAASETPSSDPEHKALTPSSDPEHKALTDRVLATIYGQCTGDAIGLLTEFLSKEEAKTHYGRVCKQLEFKYKVSDMHRKYWEEGDWTDDSDQMLLILLSIIDNNGKVDHIDFAKRLKNWTWKGYEELGDYGGVGIGTTTMTVVDDPNYTDDPHATAYLVWDQSGQRVAPNGGVMRTSVLGIHEYQNLDLVSKNAIAIVKTTHADPRCQASAVAVSVAIAMMLQRNPKHLEENGTYNIKEIINDVYEHASKCLETDEQKAELKTYLECKSLKDLKLDAHGIGYTYKTMGSGFWGLKQDNFREAIQSITMEGGDADTNASVAGALLGCKLGLAEIPVSWKDNLKHKAWLDAIIQRCQASAVAVSVAIAMMLQRNSKHLEENGTYSIKEIINDVYEHASKCLETDEQKAELKTYLECKSLKDLKLDAHGIGYTYKSMGSGFWGLKQDNFREAIQSITMEGGDADTNACVAGALLGCKLGLAEIPVSWKDNLKHKAWLDAIIQRYFDMVGWREKNADSS